MQILRQLLLAGQLLGDGHRAGGVASEHLQLPPALLTEPITLNRVEVVAPNSPIGMLSGNPRHERTPCSLTARHKLRQRTSAVLSIR